jgi:alpha-tubulin suppressor-like RCC1 family protein
MRLTFIRRLGWGVSHTRSLSASLMVLGLGLGSCTRETIAPTTVPGAATGHWSANGPDFVATMDLVDTVVIATRVGTVTGGGDLAGPGITGGDVSLVVHGTDSSRAVLLVITAQGYASTVFTGLMVADTEMDGKLNGSGFNQLALQFHHHPVVVSLTVGPQGDSTIPGRTVQFVDTAFDLAGRPIGSQPATWSTSDPTRATISPGGLLSAIAPGPVTVRATHETVVGETQFNVLRPVASVTIAPAPLSLVVPASLPLAALLQDASGSVITGRAMSWSSSNPPVAPVTPSGEVTAQALGSADIRASVDLDGRTGVAYASIRTMHLTQLTGGATHTCGVDADGTAACWGDGLVGQLGVAVRTNILAAAFVSGGIRFHVLSAGHAHTCGLAVDSAAYCWGGDWFGQLGDGNNTTDTVPAPVTGGLKFAALTVGYDHTCGLVAGGAAYCWGSNLYGELGIGSSSQVPNPNPVPVSGGLSFTSLAAGTAHTCGLTSDSTAYCWGRNDLGSVGDSTTTGRDLPTLVAGGHKFAVITAGASHTCAITGAGEAYCWGNNGEGQVGDSSGNVQVNFPVAVHAGGVLFTAIAAGYNHTCARATSGQIYCWGGNENGQSGPNASPAHVLAPVGLTGTAIVTGGWHSCAITADGAYCWGYAQLGQLGVGSAFQQSATPLKVAGQQ